MQFYRQLYFRARPEPSLRLPLNVRSAGHYRLGDRSPLESNRPRPFHQVFWIIEGEGTFRVGGRTWRCGPGQAFVYRTGEAHHIRRVGPLWRYRWMTLDGPSAAAVLAAFGWTSRRRMAGPCPEAEFERLQLALREPGPEGECLASATAYQILTLATAGSREMNARDGMDREAGRCRKIMEENFADPRFGLAELARAVGRHRTTVFRRFRDAFGLAPAAYLRHLRLQSALGALQDPRLSIQEVAGVAGFADANYFARAVRRATGSSPRELRRG